MGMHAVENSELAHGIGHGLVWPDYLQGIERKRQKLEKQTRYEKENRKEKTSILWHSGSVVCILLELLQVEARFMVKVPFKARLCLKGLQFLKK